VPELVSAVQSPNVEGVVLQDGKDGSRREKCRIEEDEKGDTNAIFSLSYKV
jgi:hypothetical protein